MQSRLLSIVGAYRELFAPVHQLCCIPGQLLTTNTFSFNAQILWSMAGEGTCLKLTRELERETA